MEIRTLPVPPLAKARLAKISQEAKARKRAQLEAIKLRKSKTFWM
jgi:hypothetical protein